MNFRGRAANVESRRGVQDAGAPAVVSWLLGASEFWRSATSCLYLVSLP